MGMRSKPSKRLVAIGLLFLCAATAMHIACIAVPRYSVMKDYRSVLMSISEVLQEVDTMQNMSQELNNDIYASMNAYYGLFQYCTDLAGYYRCLTFNLDPQYVPSTADPDEFAFETPGWLIACQVLSILALISIGLAIFPGFAILIRPSGILGRPVVVTALAGTGGILVLAANILFMSLKNSAFLMTSNVLASDSEANVQSISDYDWGLVLEIFDDHFTSGPALLADMVVPVLALVGAVIFGVLGYWDFNYNARALYQNQEEPQKDEMSNNINWIVKGAF